MNYPLGKKFFQLILNLAYLATFIVRIFPPETSHDLTLKSLKIIDSMGFRLRGKSQKKTNYFDDPIKDWLGYFEKHQHFKKLMHKYDPWKPSKKREYLHFN